MTILKPIFNRRSNRNTAFLVLLAWLFTLISGLANACPPEIGASNHLGAWAAHSFEAVAAAKISAEHGQAGADHDTGSDASKVSCLQIFDDPSQVLFKQRSGLDLAASALLPWVVALRPAAAVVVPTPNRLAALQPPAPGRAIRVRFSRLAL